MERYVGQLHRVPAMQESGMSTSAAPVDESAPLGSHMSDELFDLIGKDYDDQEIRHRLRDGMTFCDNPDLDIVLCPHLLSLANGFERVGRELERLRQAGYLEAERALKNNYVWISSKTGRATLMKIPKFDPKI